MKDMFGRKLKPWDVVISTDEDGYIYLNVVVKESDDPDYAVIREVLSDNILNGEYIYPTEDLVLLSIPSNLAIKLDTMKASGEKL